MIKLFACLTLAIALIATPALAQDLPSYEAVITDQVPNNKLSLDCTITEPVDKDKLRALAEKVYADHNGKSYKNVFIMWYLPHYEKGAGAWGITNFTGGGSVPDVSIMALQG